MSDPFENRGKSGIKSIQRGVGSGGNITIAAVNPAKTEMRFMGGDAFNSGVFAGVPKVSLFNSTTVNVSNIGTSNSAGWELTEWY